MVDDSFVRNTQANDLREVFAKDAEIQVGGSSKIAQKLYIRGFEDRMFRIKLDGITQGGNLFHHQGNLLFSPYLLKSIEIEKGLASAEYGANALAGGITITTKNAFDLLGANRNYGAYFSIGGQSNRGVDSSVATYGKITNNLGLLVGYDFNNTPYYRAGNGSKVPSSPFQAHNALFKLTFLPNENHSLALIDSIISTIAIIAGMTYLINSSKMQGVLSTLEVTSDIFRMGSDFIILLFTSILVSIVSVVFVIIKQKDL